MAFTNLKIAKKLTVGFGAILAIVGASSAISITKLQQLTEIEHQNSDTGDALESVQSARGDLEAARSAVRKYVLTGAAADNAVREAGETELAKDLARIETILAKDNPSLLPALSGYQEKVTAYFGKRRPSRIQVRYERRDACRRRRNGHLACERALCRCCRCRVQDAAREDLRLE